MKKRHDAVLVRDIVEASELAQSFLQGVALPVFLNDMLRQAGVCRQLEIIGEAANRLSPQFRSQHPAVPWKKMIAMRNILIHMYEEVDVEELWATVKNDLPKLVTHLA
ncbi:MAG: DUF86 domain-containing protein [Deltaproteobacteria bacterium]|nr:DUF86 domain-containing protein [Deltaproteobacteria bacterium]